MKYLLLPLAVILLIAGCGTSPEKQALDKFETGLAYLDEFDYAAADKVFREITESDSAGVLGLYGHGLTFERQLMYLDALDIYTVAINADSSFAPALARICKILNHFELYEDALRAAGAYNRWHPDDPDGQLSMAGTMVNNGLDSRARQAVDEAGFDGEHRVQGMLIKAMAFFDEAKFDSAQIVIESALADLNDAPSNYMQAAAYFEKAGLVDSSISLSEQAVNLSDYDFDILMEHFYRCLRTGYFSQARRVVDHLVTAGGGDQMRFGTMLLYNIARDDKIAARAMSEKYRAFGVNQLTPSYYELLTGIPLRLETLVKDELNFLKITMTKRHCDEGFQVIVYYLVALAHVGINMPLESLDNFYALPGVYSNRLPAKLATASSLYNSGQPEEATRLMEIIVMGHSDRPEWMAGVADVYQAGHIRFYDQAESYYNMALDLNKWYLPAFTNQVRMFRRIGQPQKALQLFARYPHFEKRFPAVAILKTICLAENGRKDEALGLFADNIPYVRGDLRQSKEMIEALHGDTIAIERVITLVEQLNETDPDALIMASNFYIDHKDFTKALDLAENAVDLESDYKPARITYAYARYGLGEKQEALEILDSLYAIDQDDLLVDYTISRILVQEGIDLDRAVNLARRALMSSFVGYDEWMHLCRAYYRTGRYDLCRGEATKATRKYENRPGPYFWMGMAQYRENNNLEARKNLEKAISFGLDGEELTQAREILAKL